MKKSLFLFGFLFSVLCFSQSVLSDHSNMRPKKSGSQPLIEEAVRQAVVVFNQSYQISDSTGRLFNRIDKNGNFNEINSIGIWTKDAVCVTDRVLTPWENDPLFQEYKAEYSPVQCSTSYHLLGKERKTFYTDSLHFDTIYSNLLFSWKSKIWRNNGFTLGNGIGEIDGYMVWISVEDTNTFDSLTFVTEHTRINFTNKENIYTLVAPNVPTKTSNIQNLVWPKSVKNIVGGIFVVPVFNKIGTIELKLYGIAINIQNNWKLIKTFVPQNKKGNDGEPMEKYKRPSPQQAQGNTKKQEPTNDRTSTSNNKANTKK